MPDTSPLDAVKPAAGTTDLPARKLRGELGRALGIAVSDPHLHDPKTREMPLPRNWNTVFLGILTMIAVLACLYVAREPAARSIHFRNRSPAATPPHRTITPAYPRFASGSRH